MTNNYSVTISETSRENLTARERLFFADTSSAKTLDSIVPENGEGIIITPVDYAVLNIHNDKAKSDEKDYTQYLIIDSDNKSYITGSNSFWNSFIGIYNVMKGENESYEIKIERKPSKNYTGKSFLTCSII